MAKQKILAPWEVLKSLVDEYQLTLGQMASDLKMSVSMVRQILIGKSKISVHVAMRLAKYFNLTIDYWLNLQTQYDLAEAQKEPTLSAALKSIPKAKKAKPGAKKVESAKTAKAPKGAKPGKLPTKAKAAKDSATEAGDKPKRGRKASKEPKPVEAEGKPKRAGRGPAKAAKDSVPEAGDKPKRGRKATKEPKPIEAEGKPKRAGRGPAKAAKDSVPEAGDKPRRGRKVAKEPKPPVEMEDKPKRTRKPKPASVPVQTVLVDELIAEKPKLHTILIKKPKDEVKDEGEENSVPTQSENTSPPNLSFDFTPTVNNNPTENDE